MAMGKPTHAASPRGEKSTSPMQAAMIYDTTTPRSTGIILMMPLPHTEDVMTVTMAMIANSQLVWQLAIAEPESTSPIAITMGPVTTGGKKCRIFWMPNDLISPAITK